MSYVELLATIVIMAAVLSIGVVAITVAVKRSGENALEQNVATLNRAIGAYLMSGGSLSNPVSDAEAMLGEAFADHYPDGITEEEAVMLKLQTLVSADQAKEINGLRSSFIDRRLKAKVHRAQDGEYEGTLVVWNAAANKFEFSDAADEGILAVEYQETAVAALNDVTENREPVLKLAKVDPWVWDYDPQEVSSLQGNYIVAGGDYTGPGGFVPGNPSALPLAPPDFSDPGGIYPLATFNRELTLSDPNYPGTSEVLFSVNGGAWQIYEGQTITVELGTEVMAYAKSLDRDYWTDSEIRAEHYDADPVQLEVDGQGGESYTYDEVGGEMVDSNEEALASAATPYHIALTNPHEIPGWLLDTDPFRFRYTYDGSEPLTSASAEEVGGFSNGRVEVELDISLPRWGNLVSLPIALAGKSLHPYLEDSVPALKPIAAAPTALPAPIPSLQSGIFTSNQAIGFKRDPSLGTLPRGARIAVSTDGSDPLTAEGEPAAGAVLVEDLVDSVEADTIWGQRFKDTVNAFAPDGTPRQLVARVAGPQGYGHWFVPSAPVQISPQQYEVEPWDGFIGGDFATTATVDFWHIKQTGPDGPLDKTFNPGTGFDQPVKDVAIDLNGYTVAVGYFSEYDGTPRRGIVRITPTGDIDASLDPGSGFEGDPECVTIQNDGKILVGGDFSGYNGEAINRILRLNPDGSRDTSFNPGAGADNDVYAIALQTDGKMVVGGHFSKMNGSGRNCLCRLNADGTLDNSFSVGNGANDVILDLAIDTSGRVVIVGEFSKYGSLYSVRVARVLADGSPDTSFNVGRGANKEVDTVSIYPEGTAAAGKIFIAGRFSSYDKVVRKGVARINSNGSRDESFDIGNGLAIPSWRLYDSAIAADGKVVIAGRLTAYNPNSRSAFKRLNLDGSIDQTFTPEDLPQGSITYAVAIPQNSGKVVIGGDFTQTVTIDGQRDIAKLNVGDGALDGSFDVGSGTNPDGRVEGLAVQGDGKVLIGGTFLSVAGKTHSRIARLNPDGSVDDTFQTAVAKGSEGYSLIDFENAQFEHGTIINDQYYDEMGIMISALNNVDSKLDLAILFDTNFSNTADPDLESPWSGGNITQRPFGLYTDFGNALIIAENGNDTNGDGIIDNPDDEASGGSVTFTMSYDNIIGFQATFIDFQETTNYSIYFTDSELNAAVVNFSEFTDPNSLWYDPYIAIGDNYVNILPTIWSDDVGLNHFREITFDYPGSGAIDQLYFITDPNFDPNNIAIATVSSIAVQDDGGIVIGGNFGLVNWTRRNCIAKLDSSGALDTSFDPGDGFDGPVHSVAVDASGRIVVGGGFSSYDGNAAPGLVRLLPNGALDTTFATAPAGTLVYDIEILPTGHVVYVGTFSSPGNGIAMVDPNGESVPWFDSGAGASDVRAVDLQEDGKLVIGGGFSTYDGSPAARIARVNWNGEFDVSFDAGTGADGSVREVQVMEDGKVLVAGEFGTVAGVARDGIAMLEESGAIYSGFNQTGLDVNTINRTR